MDGEGIVQNIRGGRTIGLEKRHWKEKLEERNFGEGNVSGRTIGERNGSGRNVMGTKYMVKY